MKNAEELFRQLRDAEGRFERRNPDGVYLETARSNSGGAFTAFRDTDGAIGILIPFGDDETAKFKPDVRSKYITLKRVSRNQSDHAQLRLENPLLEGVFEIFVDNLFDALKDSPENAVSQAASQLDRWRTLFTAASADGLGPEEELGLVAELETLRDLLESDGASAYKRWTGPDKQAHDFRFNDRGIECKSTRSSSGLTVTISSADQLKPEPGNRLLLIVRKYEVTPNGDVTLRDLIESLAKDPRVPAEEFLRTLTSMGLSLTSGGFDSESRYQPLETHVFDVSEDFPKVTSEDLPSRVESFSYRLNLNPPEEIPGYREAGTLH